MKNLAGNRVSTFLYRFVPRNNGITFVLNESIAEDLYPDTDEHLQPLVQACSETLMRYRHLCQGDVIMDGNILEDGYFEVMLEAGLGKHFIDKEKQNLFSDANEIAQLLMEIIDKRTAELEQGTYSGGQPLIPKILRTQSTNQGLETLARERESLEPSITDGEALGLNRLTPDDLPQGVRAQKGYDHRGRCYAFEHTTLGELGKIILIDVSGRTLLEAELHTGNSGALPEKKKVFSDVIAVVEAGLRNARKNI